MFSYILVRESFLISPLSPLAGFDSPHNNCTRLVERVVAAPQPAAAEHEFGSGIAPTSAVTCGVDASKHDTCLLFCAACWLMFRFSHWHRLIW
jgi:hypothetical protein